MNSISDIQLKLFNDIRKSICNKVTFLPVGKGAIEVTMPFLDWKGVPVSIFITSEGRITDGGKIISQLDSLRVLDDYKNWEFKLDYFYRFNIQQSRWNLEPAHSDSSEGILRYIQGMTRLPNFFEPKPLHSNQDEYPKIVEKIAKKALMDIAPQEKMEDRELWAVGFTEERRIPLEGIVIYSDMSPRNIHTMVKIFSYAKSNTTIRRQHVRSKLLDPVLYKAEISNVELVAVMEDKDAYPSDAQAFINKEASCIIETKNGSAGAQLAEVLTE